MVVPVESVTEARTRWHGARTKLAKELGQSHLVPLSRQTLALFEELRDLTGGYRYMWPGIRRPAMSPMSAETINKALKIMGFEDRQSVPTHESTVPNAVPEKRVGLGLARLGSITSPECKKAHQLNDLGGLSEQCLALPGKFGGRRYWNRTNDLYDVNVAL